MGDTIDNSSSSPKPIPPFIPDYEMLRVIGHGAYGEVWMARTVTGELRAVKVVRRAQFEDPRPFDREFEGISHATMVSRAHAGLVDILHIGRNDEEGYFYYVMELADDEERGREIDEDTYRPKTLRSELRRRKRLPVAECVTLGVSILEGIEHLHKNKLVHRDIKPANIIFVDGQPKLADIGLVCDADDTLSFVGTMGYLPPEGPGRPQADIFSFGKVLYEISTGRDRMDFPEMPTFAGELDGATMYELNTVLLRACEANSRKRYASAERMLEDLRTLADGRLLKNSPSRIRARRAVFAAAMVLLVSLGWVYPMLKSAHVSKPEWDFDYGYSNVTEPNADRHLIEQYMVRKYVEWQSPPNTYWGPTTNNVEGRLTYRFIFPEVTRQVRLQVTLTSFDFRELKNGKGWGCESLYLSTDGNKWKQIDPIGIVPDSYSYNFDVPPEFTATNKLYVQVRMLVHEADNNQYTVVQHSTATIGTANVQKFRLRAKYTSNPSGIHRAGKALVIDTTTPILAARKSITLNGAGFKGATAVTFNGIGSSFEVKNDSNIVARIPLDGDINGPIKVWHNQRVSSTDNYTHSRTGLLVAFGKNDEGQCAVPADLGLVKAFAAGPNHSFAIQTNGTLVSWGKYKSMTPVSDKFRRDAVALSTSDVQTMVLHADSSLGIVFHKILPEFQTHVLSNIVAIASGQRSSLSLQSDGHVFATGWYAEMREVPPSLNNVIAIASGANHHLALRQDGTVFAWGSGVDGQAAIPEGLDDVVAIAAGSQHNLALRRDGTVATWGLNTSGQCDRPASCTRVVAIAAGAGHSVALKADGRIVLWGKLTGADDLPVKISDDQKFSAISSGAHHVLAMKSEDLGLSITKQLATVTSDKTPAAVSKDK